MKRLSLDIGTKSIGWAVISNKRIIDGGVHLWDASENPKSLSTNAEARREIRSSKRNSRRKDQRIKELKELLTQETKITMEEIKEHYEKLVSKEFPDYSPKKTKELDHLFLRYDTVKNKRQLTPLELVIIAMYYVKLRGYENIFETDSEYGKESEELIEKYKFPIIAIIEDNSFKSSNKPTEIIYRNHNKERKTDEAKAKDKNFGRDTLLFLTPDLKNEFREIMEINKSLFNNSDSIEKIINLTFRKRDFEDGPTPKDSNHKEAYIKGLKSEANHYKPFIETIGNCSFIPTEKRTNPFSILGDLFLIENYIGQLFSKDDVEKMGKDKLKMFSRDMIVNYLKTKKLDSKAVKANFLKHELSLSEYEKDISIPTNMFLNQLSKMKEPKAFQNTLTNELEEVIELFSNPFGPSELDSNQNQNQNQNLNMIVNNKINQIGKIIYENKTPKRIVEMIKELDLNIGLENNIKTFVKKLKANSTFNVSSKHIFNVVSKNLNEGIIIHEYQAQIKKELDLKRKEEVIKVINNNNGIMEIFKPIYDVDMKKNAVVFMAINEVRKLIKKLFKEFGGFDAIVIEVARDVYNEKSKRKAIRDAQQKNQNTNYEYSKFLTSKGLRNSIVNRNKLVLFEKQGGNVKNNKDAIDPMSLTSTTTEYIKLNELFSSKYQIDHIVPQSISNDDSINNKMIISVSNNIKKGNRTPFGFINNNETKQTKEWKFFANNVKKTFKRNKGFVDRLLMTKLDRKSMVENDTNRINDTRYITKYIANYLKEEMYKYQVNNGLKQAPEVIVINGSITSYVRRQALNNNDWGNYFKPRALTPYHHMVDAVILGSLGDKFDLFAITQLQRLRGVFAYNQKLISNSDSFEKVKENINKIFNSINYNLKFSSKFFRVDDNYLKLDDEQILTKKELRENKITDIIDGFESLKEAIIEKLSLNETFDFSINNPIISRLFNLSVDNISEEVTKFIPLKIDVEEKLDENGVVKSTNFITKSISKPKEWAIETGRDIKDYPYVSHRVESTLIKTFSKPNPISWNEVIDEVLEIKQKELIKLLKKGNKMTDEDKVKVDDLEQQINTRSKSLVSKEFLDNRFMFEKNGHIFKAWEYVGVRYDINKKTFVKYSKYDNLKRKAKGDFVIRRNTPIEIDGNGSVIRYTGLSADRLFFSRMGRLGNTDKKLVEGIGITSLSKMKKIEIVEINILGKRLGSRVLII